MGRGARIPLPSCKVVYSALPGALSRVIGAEVETKMFGTHCGVFLERFLIAVTLLLVWQIAGAQEPTDPATQGGAAAEEAESPAEAALPVYLRDEVARKPT